MTTRGKKKAGKTGVWLIGAKGGLATTIMVGSRLIAKGLVNPTGLLTETKPFAKIDVPKIGDLVFGGHDIREGSLFAGAMEIDGENRTFDREKLRAIRFDLDAIDADIKPGTALNSGPAVERLASRRSGPAKTQAPAALVERLAADIASFRKRHDLASVIVVNVASTEPPIEPDPALDRAASLRKLLTSRRSRHLRASTLYGMAAVTAGSAFINFTPNQGSLVQGIQEMALENGVLVMGNDGKTGETLVKSALAPMFKYRNLRVLTWQGYNILGDRDGQVLADPEHKRSKIITKDGVLSGILGYPLHTHVGIDYVPSLKDQKTAWDFVHFAGFLDYKMSLQFIWQGCDAILAAPVVLDMVRMAECSRRSGESGLMKHLACFFKSPLGVDEHDLHFQFHGLLDWVGRRGK